MPVGQVHSVKRFLLVAALLLAGTEASIARDIKFWAVADPLYLKSRDADGGDTEISDNVCALLPA